MTKKELLEKALDLLDAGGWGSDETDEYEKDEWSRRVRVNYRKKVMKKLRQLGAAELAKELKRLERALGL